MGDRTTMSGKKSYEELLIQREFDLLELTVELVGDALLAEIERLRTLLRQLQANYENQFPCRQKESEAT